jgi:hypothetical protein
MNLQLFRQALLLWGLVAGIMLWVQPSVSWAASLTVNTGYDLFVTVSGAAIASYFWAKLRRMRSRASVERQAR